MSWHAPSSPPQQGNSDQDLWPVKPLAQLHVCRSSALFLNLLRSVEVLSRPKAKQHGLLFIVYCSSSSGLKFSAACRAQQVWLGDDLHLRRISAAPPGGAGRLTLLRRDAMSAGKAIRAHSLGKNEICKAVMIHGVGISATPDWFWKVQ